MAQPTTHIERVDAWLEVTASGLSATQHIDLYERAFAAVWNQAHRTLGEITLTAIVDRVLNTSVRAFPLLSEVQVSHTGISLAGLHSNGSTRPFAGDALRFMLLELVSVLGSVTAEILTPSLHAALAEVRLPGDSEPELENRSLPTGTAHDEVPSK